VLKSSFSCQWDPVKVILCFINSTNAQLLLVTIKGAQTLSCKITKMWSLESSDPPMVPHVIASQPTQDHQVRGWNIAWMCWWEERIIPEKLKKYRSTAMDYYFANLLNHQFLGEISFTWIRFDLALQIVSHHKKLKHLKHQMNCSVKFHTSSILVLQIVPR